MDKKYKPLTAPDKKAYEPYVKPVYVDDKTKQKSTWKGKPKQATKPKPMWRVCEKCHNLISHNGICDFCGHTNTQKIYTVSV